ncbi:NTP transferase domain-containing protein [Pelagibius sp.]|uniref:NTP transferase domain-containing protein n=1 Tax=Pelagibius sp. TaxID=1931238 RepID=UPI003B504411
MSPALAEPEDRRFAALVLAADRGHDDPVSRAAGVEHKCLATVAGKPMLERVIDTLAASPWIGPIAVSLRDPALLGRIEGLAPLMETGRLTALQAEASPSLSVLQATADMGSARPLLITTGDHALLRREIVDHFCAETLSGGAAVTAGLTDSGTLLARFPSSRRTYLRFRDERYSGSNLFALRLPEGLDAVRLWRRVEQHRKQPWRIAALFGPALLLSYLLRRFSLDEAMARVSTRLGVSVAAVKIPFAEAAVDVDKPEDLELAERVLGGLG